jgi:DNA (cytosine-5)-methyltransferase 1
MNWVSEKYKMGDKSARDVVSRLKRVTKYVDVDLPITDEELIFKLEITEEFKNLSMTVKSQLKRSIKLYREYKKEN